MTVTIYSTKYNCKYILHEVVRIDVTDKKYIITRRTSNGYEFPSDYSKRQYKLLSIEA